jgi:hypothetical protein
MNVTIWPNTTAFTTDDFGLPLCPSEKPWELLWQLIVPYYSVQLKVINLFSK